MSWSTVVEKKFICCGHILLTYLQRNQRNQQERQDCNDQEPHARQVLLSRGLEIKKASMGLQYVVVDNSCLISTLSSSTGAEVQLFETHFSDMLQRNQQERQDCNDQEPHARQMPLSRGLELKNASACMRL